MFLTTRCPQCRTTFEVAPDQLRMRGGLVRCGECSTVFDGRACRVDAVAASADAVKPPAVLRQRARLVSHDSRVTTQQSANVALPRQDDEGAEGMPSATPAAPLFVAQPHPYARARELPDFMDEHAAIARRRARWLWRLAALLALLALIVQTLLVFRVAIVTTAPMLRPAFETLCQPLGCVVGYERRAERLAITASSLQPTRSGELADGVSRQLLLGVTLRNRFLHPQRWPALMLELRDFSDTVVIRRALLPGEYLPEALISQPLQAGSEIALSIPLSVTGAQISGYRVEAFYP